MSGERMLQQTEKLTLDLEELYDQLEKADESTVLEILQSHLDDSQLDAKVKKWVSETALSKACRSGYVRVLKQALDEGRDPNLPVNEGGTMPMQFAALCGQLEIVRVLIDAHADVNTGCQVIHYALFDVWHGGCSKKHLKLLQALVENGSEWDLTCDQIAEQAAPWPSSMKSYGEFNTNFEERRWRRVAPAMRVCVERWKQQHKQGLPFTHVPLEQIRNGEDATKIYIEKWLSHEMSTSNSRSARWDPATGAKLVS